MLSIAYIIALMMLVLVATPLAILGGVVGAIYFIVKWIKRGQEKAAEAEEIDRLEAQAKTLVAGVSAPDYIARAIMVGVLQGLTDNDEPLPHPAIAEALGTLFAELYAAEHFDVMPSRPAAADTVAMERFRADLRTVIARLSPGGASETFVPLAAQMFQEFVSELPPFALCDPATFDAICEHGETASSSVRLLDVVEAGSAVGALAAPLFGDEVRQTKLCEGVRERVRENQHLLSRIPFTPDRSGDPRLIAPAAFKGSAEDCVTGYLSGTPLLSLFNLRLPFTIPEAARCEHHWIVAGSGHGKTQLLQQMILNDFQRDDPPALIVIDSQGSLLRNIAHLAQFEDTDRLVMIDPEDERPPALNVFDMSTARLEGYSRRVREEVEAGIIELYSYIFGSIAAELTAKQGTAFAFVARLMLAIPGATIHTLRELMEEDARTLHDSRFAPAIATLDPTARAFFENQFYNRNAFGQTRQQIARRLYGVLQVPTFDRMLSSRESRLDMFEAMQGGKVVLVNTSRSLLKADASALFGRYMIAQTLRATYERAALPERERRPAYLVIDEASEYFDDNLDTLLKQARKFNLGIVFAHQYVDQLSATLRASVASNTSIKMAGGLSDKDARALAPDMKTSPEFLLAQAKDSAVPPRFSEFACYVRNHTPRAVSLQIPFGVLERAPRMSGRSFEQLIAANRDRYGVPADTPTPAATEPDLSPRVATPHDAPRPAATVAVSRPATVKQPEPVTTAPSGESDDWRS